MICDFKEILQREFPGGTVVRTLHSHCWYLGSVSSQELRSLKPSVATKKKKKVVWSRVENKSMCSSGAGLRWGVSSLLLEMDPPPQKPWS